MKIIKTGKEWKHRLNCKCQTVLEVTKEDITYKVSDEAALAQNDRLEVEGDYFVVCPLCKTQLKVKNIPIAIKEELKNG